MRSKQKTRAQLAERVACAHSNLNLWGSIVVLLEGGLLYGGGTAVANRVIKTAKKEMRKYLEEYEAAVAALEGL